MGGKVIAFILLASIIGCNSPYDECNEQLYSCSNNVDAEYCLFGYKWGDDPILENEGPNAIGPQSSGGVITYSFQEKEQRINTNNVKNQKVVPFSTKASCARREVENALRAFEEFADLEFQQLADDTVADLRFYVVDVDRNFGLGNTNYQDELCSDIAGLVYFGNTSVVSCHRFYILVLHEVGHALGLGHVASANVMASGSAKYEYDGLQQGDIDGILTLYGAK